MSLRPAFRLGAKALHEIASIGFGGALLACLVINVAFSDPAVSAELATARQLFSAIASYVLIPSMAIVVLSGLFALAATRGYLGARWAWLKALLGLSLFEATLLVVGSSSRSEELAAAIAAQDVANVDAMLRSERYTLLLLIALSVVNVLLAVWRPRLSMSKVAKL